MQSTTELSAQLEAVQRQLDELTAKVASNDTKMRRSQERELRLLHAEDLQSLIHELTHGLRVSYGLQHVSLVLYDPDHDVRHLLLASGTPAEGFENLLMKESLTGLAPQYVALHEPWLGAYRRCDHQLLFPKADGLASIAMIPLRHRDTLIGSINLGSEDLTRFTRAHRFYERSGYERTGRTRELHDISNTTEYHFTKSIRT